MKHGTGYGPVFLIAGTLHVLAFLLILATIREVRPMEIAASAGEKEEGLQDADEHGSDPFIRVLLCPEMS